MLVDYPQLIKKDMLLCGIGKFQQDIESFFTDLNIFAYIDVSDSVEKHKGKDVYPLRSLQASVWRERMTVICAFQTEFISRILEEYGLVYGVDYIHGIDLIAIVDETETYNITSNYKGKKIIVMGTGYNCEKLMMRNPHLDVTYYVDNDADKHGNIVFSKKVYPVDVVKSEEYGSFVILCTPSDILTIRCQMEKLGLVFGDDFYFYDADAFPFSPIESAKKSFAYYLAVNDIQHNSPLPVAVFGVNRISADLLDANIPIKIEYFITDNQERTGRPFYGRKVVHVSDLSDMSGGILLVTEEDANLFQDKAIEKKWKIFYHTEHTHAKCAYRLSELLCRTIASHFISNSTCSVDTYHPIFISNTSSITFCSALMDVPYIGKLLYNSFEQNLKSTVSRIVQLSISNKTYCFCLKRCDYFKKASTHWNEENAINKILPKKTSDFRLSLCYDNSCNLACKSCRSKKIFEPEGDKARLDALHFEVKRNLSKLKRNIWCGNGEAFYSEYLRDIFLYENPLKNITFFTNGLLFNADNWSLLKSKYDHITMRFSIDAATKETYSIIRGGNWELLCRNLKYAAQLRSKGEIDHIELAFVVQRDNFREMIAFVNWGKELRVDGILFQPIVDWGLLSADDFFDINVVNEYNPYHNEYIDILSNPCFDEPWVVIGYVDVPYDSRL